ncbi:hypothetical protein LWI28_003232 [Acer negundo]|uniref:Oxidoreductase-like domain-containing protein n=1 Tax=Acer negundo TaxID=4023 RepID=A0AAD5NKD0_ACENE|nr:hypothetical protein LWI28_003232 [Acer negundo]
MLEAIAHYQHASPLLTDNHRQKPNHATAPAMSLIIRSTADLLLHHHHNHHHNHNLTFFKRVVCANATKNDSPFRDSRVSCFDDNTSTIVKRMAAMTTKNDQAAIEVNIEKKQEEEERESKKSMQPPPPPLPEKPEPGDCCGSGCVRCVWDVYYEELEAYDKLYNNSDPKNSKSN